jgi:Bacterial protein of unknown function (DUF899)
MAFPEVVPREQWLEARRRLLAEEKNETRRRDVLNAERRRLPMVRIEKEYVFDGRDLPHLFDLRAGQRVHPQPLHAARPDRLGQAGSLGAAQRPRPGPARHVTGSYRSLGPGCGSCRPRGGVAR